MKKYLAQILIAVFWMGLFSNATYAENRKLAQTGLKFLSVSMDARASALGGAYTALEVNSTSLLYNPAGMANISDFFHVAMGQVNWIADIKYLFGTASLSFENGRYGVFGVSFISVDYGDFKGTIRADNEQGFVDTGIFNPTALAFGIGYAKALSDKFSVGGQVRYVYQNLTGGAVEFDFDETVVSQNFTLDVFAFDFGILYKTGFKSLNFGMNIRNFSRELKYLEESFQLPLTFEMGLSINAVDLIEVLNPDKHTLLVSVDAVHPRDYDEQMNIGVEYKFLQTFSLRMGYTFPVDEQGMTFGAGIYKMISNFGLGVDYSYTPFGIFEDVHRFTIQISL